MLQEFEKSATIFVFGILVNQLQAESQQEKEENEDVLEGVHRKVHSIIQLEKPLS